MTLPESDAEMVNSLDGEPRGEGRHAVVPEHAVQPQVSARVASQPCAVCVDAARRQEL